MLLDWNRWGRLALTVGFAVLGGWCALYVHVPLPWVLGPMVAVACVSMANQVYKQPVLARKSAQIYIGASIGLYFTPAVLQLIGGLAPWMVLGAFVGIFMSVLSAMAPPPFIRWHWAHLLRCRCRLNVPALMARW
jgi:uncharacterized membrane protein AbrB (regulator of aidB expression)